MPAASSQFCSSHVARSKGGSGEQFVVDLLIQQNWQIIARNLRYKGSELDIVCFKDGILNVVEVKQRRQAACLAENLLSYRKCCAIRRGVAALLTDDRFQKWAYEAKTIRCDLIIVTNQYSVQQWFENVLELG